MSDIVRRLPSTKPHISYEYRYSKEDFDKIRNIINNEKEKDDYSIWLSGYNPDTGRKLNKNKGLYKSIGNRFKYFINYKSIYKELLDNEEKYIKETKRLNEKVDKKNKYIDKYNEQAKEAIDLVNTLESWEDYVEFDGKKYGIPYIAKDDIHIENDCLGKLVFDHSEGALFSRDFRIEDKYVEDYYKYYKCDKCNQMLEATNWFGEKKYIKITPD